MAFKPDLIGSWFIGISCRVEFVWHGSARDASTILALRCQRLDTLVLIEVLFQGREAILQQAQLAGAGDGFRAAFDLQFVEDAAVVPFHCVQGQEQPLADFTIGQSLRDQLQNF